MFDKKLLLICVTTLFVIPSSEGAKYWTWTCEDYKCVKTRLANNTDPTVSPEICELTCSEYSRIWPMPVGKFEIEREIVSIDLEDGYTGSGIGSPTLKEMVHRFFKITSTYNDHKKNTATGVTGKTRIHFEINDVESTKLNLDTDEGYTLQIFENEDAFVNITIQAANLFGARHALETLSQVLVFNDNGQVYVVPKRLLIEDAPVYPIRGLMIDTARSFLSVNTITRIIEGMAVNKLNTLHWHITDSQSFPFQSTLLPHLSDLGAFSAKEVFTTKNVADLMEWARVRGVRILPEFDGPAHVGEGWQDSDLVVCFNKQPWGWYCKEPPCGQFDPTKEELYSTLQLLYRDMIEAFDPDLFHFGGDEVNFECWRSVKSITKWMTENGLNHTDSDYVELWDYYQNRTYNVFMQERQREIPAVIWTSTLTNKNNLKHLPNDKYIIHVWTDQYDATIKHLLENDYKMIISNYDKLYLDCGFHSWTSAGNNWCGPYIGWKEIYENSPAKIIAKFGNGTDKPHLIMGSMTALWTETVDDASAENRIWPRTSALAERVWAEPSTKWSAAEYRLDSQRGRLIKLGINADTMIPQWCFDNQGSCR